MLQIGVDGSYYSQHRPGWTDPPLPPVFSSDKEHQTSAVQLAQCHPHKTLDIDNTSIAMGHNCKVEVLVTRRGWRL